MAAPIAIHTGGTKLVVGSTDIIIKSIGDLGSEPATIDVTDLSETVMKKYIKGLQDVSTIVCTANYTKEAYKKTQGVCDDQVKTVKIVLGHDGGSFEFQATVSCWKTAIEVDAAQEYSIGLTPQSAIEFKEAGGP